LTQRDLAAKAGLTLHSIRHHEQGQRLPSWLAVQEEGRDGSLRISTAIAYLAPHDGKLSAWVGSLEAGDDRVVAHDPLRPIPWLGWRGDGRHVLYLQDRAGNENFHLFQVEITGGAPRDSTTTIEAKWLGACKSDQKPGDIMMPGGMKMNIKDMQKLKALIPKQPGK